MMTIDDRIAAVARARIHRASGALSRARDAVHAASACRANMRGSPAPRTATTVTELFARLVRDGHATAWRSLHNRGRLYHVRGRRLYEAIGEPRHRHRRPVPARQVTERLMRLDTLLAQPEVRWLVSEEEKVDYFRSLAPALPTERLPHAAAGADVRRRPRLFPGNVLVGVGESKPTFSYVVTSADEEDWRRVIARYGELLAALPCWVLRAYFPPELKPTLTRFHWLFREELAEPLSDATLGELRWHFEHLRTPATPRTRCDAERFRECQFQLLVKPRYRLLHKRWLEHGDAAFDVASSTAIAEHLAKYTWPGPLPPAAGLIPQYRCAVDAGSHSAQED